MRSDLLIEIRAELKNPAGKTIKRFPWKRANSLVKGFLHLLLVQLSQASQTIKMVDGTLILTGVATVNLSLAALAADTTYGTVIGTGTDPVTIADYKLQTQVTANINHAAPTFAFENPSATSWRVSTARVFTNNTGATVGVRETGLYMRSQSASRLVCADRTLYTVDVPNTVSLTLTYRLTITL